jgi:hypothetical protein
MAAATFIYLPDHPSGSNPNTMSSDQAFYISFSATMCFIMVLIILILADLRAWLYAVSNNLKRADDLVLKLQGARLNDTPALLAKYVNAREMREAMEKEHSRGLLMSSLVIDNNHSTISNASGETSHRIEQGHFAPMHRAGSNNSVGIEGQRKDYMVLTKPSNTPHSKRQHSSPRIHTIDETQPTVVGAASCDATDTVVSHIRSGSLRSEHSGLHLVKHNAHSGSLKVDSHLELGIAGRGMDCDGVEDIYPHPHPHCEHKSNHAEQLMILHQINGEEESPC